MLIYIITNYAFSRADRASVLLYHLPGTSAAPGSQQDLAMARQFFDGPGPGPASQQASFAAPRHVGPPGAERLMGAALPAHDLGAAWNEQQRAHMHPPIAAPGGMWSAEFDGTQMMRAPVPMHAQQQQQGMAAQANCEYIFCFARWACGIGLFENGTMGTVA